MDLSFKNIVQDLEVNELAWLSDELMIPSPDKLYVIIFTARSGSSWLTNLLSETKQLGFPEEYLNPNFVRSVAAAVNSTVPEDFLAGLQRRRKTPNGVFGIEARELDIEAFGAEYFFKAFNESATFFNLWRRNIVAQAVSLFRAVETQQFHIKQGEMVAPPPAYDSKGIGKWVIHLAMQENENFSMLMQRGRPFVNICYEEMIVNRWQVQQLFARHLDIQLVTQALAGPAEPLPAKIGDDWNDEAERRFRTDAERLLERVEANRKIQLYIPEGLNGQLMHPGVMALPVADKMRA